MSKTLPEARRMLPQRQHSRVDTSFNTIDANGDGFIDKEEWDAAMASGDVVHPPSEGTSSPKKTKPESPMLSPLGVRSGRRRSAVSIPRIESTPKGMRRCDSMSEMSSADADELEQWTELTGLEILQALEAQGILQDDSRVTESVAYLKARGSETLNSHEFSELTRKDSVVDRALNKMLVVTEFRVLCNKIENIFDDVRDFKKMKNGEEYRGDVADYIPQLAKVPASKYGLAVCSIDGQRWSVGDASDSFCIQSCSKAITYAIALEINGQEKTHRHVGREPSGKGFNARVLDDLNRPHNPMINSGAIMTCALVSPEKTIDQRFDIVMDHWKRLAGGTAPGFNNSVYLSERASADRCLSAYYLELWLTAQRC